MSAAPLGRRSGFALKLEQGLGRLALSERPVGDLLVVEQLELALQALPARLDMSAGVERFRHHRTRLEQITVYATEEALTRWLRARLERRRFQDVECRTHEGDLVVTGALVDGEHAVPFLARLRLEPAYLAGQRSLVISVYDCRLYGPGPLNPVTLSASLLGALGLEDHLSGPTCAVVDPLDEILLEICAHLGWKIPERRGIRLTAVESSGGRLRAIAGRPEGRIKGARAVEQAPQAAAHRYRRFMADYEAKTLYAGVEQQAGAGAAEAAIEAYERQLEIHPEHPFLVRRLMQLMASRAESHHRDHRLIRAHLSRYADDLDALAALATAHSARGEQDQGAEALKELARVAAERGDVIEAAQALWGAGCMLQRAEPQGAIRALKRALEKRQRLPGVLRLLADLQREVGDWTSALETLERLLAVEPDGERRRILMRDLGHLALEGAGDAESAAVYFSRVLDDQPDDLDALVGLARANERGGRVLAAAQALDRAAQIQQREGETEAAAALMVELGRLWGEVPGDNGATAMLRYRQALMLSPGHTGALLGLARVAEISGSPDQARTHYEQVLRRGEARLDESTRASIHLALGRLLGGPLGATHSAIPHLQKALRGPEDTAAEAAERLREIYVGAERWGDLARLLEVIAERQGTAEARTRALVDLAEIIGGRLGDGARARDLLEQARALSPSERAPLEALATLYRDRQEHGPLADVLQDLAGISTEPQILAGLYAERGLLLKKHLNQVDAAAEAFSLALGCDQRSVPALEGLADIYAERERFAELAPILSRLGDVATPQYAATRHRLALARLLAGPLQRPNEARRAYESVLALEADDPDALRGVADLAFDAGQEDVALEKYLRLYEVYEEEGYDEPPGPFKVRLAEVFAALNRAPEALEMLRDAAQHDPNLIPVYEKALDLYLMLGDLEGVVAFFTAGLKRARDLDTRYFLASKASRLLWRQMRRAEDAAPLLDEILDLEPHDLEAHRLRLEVATALDDWATVDTLLRAELSRANEAERPGILMRLARLAFGALQRPEEGRRFAEQALTLDPRHVPALGLLGEQAFAAEDYESARRLLDRLAAIEDDDIRPEDAYRLAVSEMYVGDPERARARLASLHHASEGPPEVITRLIECALEVDDLQMLASATFDWLKQGHPPIEAHRDLLADVGLRLVGDLAHKALATRCLEAAIELLPERGELPAALAQLEEGVAQPASPAEAAPAVVDAELDMMDRLIQGELDDDPEDEAAKRAADQQLVDAAEAAEGAEAQGEAWLAVADHRRDRLNDIDGALEALAQVIQLGPEHMPWREAFEGTEELLSIRQAWGALAALYSQARAQGGGEADELRTLEASARRAGGDVQGALATLEAVDDRGAERPLALHVELLSALGRRGEAAQRLLLALEQQPAAIRGRRLWQAAELIAASDPAAAADHYARAAELSGDPDLLDAWVTHVRAMGDQRRLGPALEALARSKSTKGAEAVQRSNLLAEAAALPETAEEARRRLLEDSLEAWPDNVEALDALGELLSTLGDDAALADVYRRQHAMALPGPFRGEIALTLARLFAGPLDWPERARRWAEAALEDLDGEEAEASEARRIIEAVGDVEAEGALDASLADLVEDDDEMDFAGLLDDLDVSLDELPTAAEPPLSLSAGEEDEGDGLEDMFAELAEELDGPVPAPIPTRPEGLSGRPILQRPARGTPPPLARPQAALKTPAPELPAPELPAPEAPVPEIAVPETIVPEMSAPDDDAHGDEGLPALTAPPVVVQRPTLDLEHPDAEAPPSQVASLSTWIEILEDEGLPFDARAEAARALAEAGEEGYKALITRMDQIIERAGEGEDAPWRALRGGIRRGVEGMDERVITDLTTAAGAGRLPLAELGLSALAEGRGDDAGAGTHAARALEAPSILGTGLTNSEAGEAFERLERILTARGEIEAIQEKALSSLSSYPGCRPALAAADAHLSEEGRWLELVRLLDDALGRSPQARQDAELWRRKAEILLDELGQAQHALDAAEEAVDRAGTWAASALARQIRRAAAKRMAVWPRLLKILEQDLAAHPGPGAEGEGEGFAALVKAHGEIAGDQLARPDVAMQQISASMTRWIDQGVEVPETVRLLYEALDERRREDH